MNVLRNIYRLHSSLISCLDCTQVPLYSSGNGLNTQMKFHYQSRYSTEEENQILKILNEFSAKELSRFDISRIRIENIKKFCNKQGSLNSLSQVLEVEGLGVQILERLCDSILAFPVVKNTELLQNKDGSINRFQMLTPSMKTLQRNALKTVVGVHIACDTVTWAHLDRDGNLLQWDLLKLPIGAKKVHLTTLLEMVLDIRSCLPKGDVFVMEDTSLPTQAAQQQMATLSSNMHHWQLKAMLLTVLNMCNDDVTPTLLKKETHELPHVHQVFFLRSRLPARLFRTLVGTEKVSAQIAVNKILGNSPNDATSDTCYTPVTIASDLRNVYMSSRNVDKEHMCQALLLTMTFMDVIVHGTPQSIKLVSRK